MKMARVKIVGTTPLLMHRFPIPMITRIEKKTPEEQAEIAAYRDVNGDLCIPGGNLHRALVSGGKYSKAKGNKTLKSIIAACLSVPGETYSLNQKTYVISAMRVVVKGAIIRYRPQIMPWELWFEVEYDETRVKEDEVKCVISDTGTFVGLLDFRPERNGRYGKFIMSEFVEIQPPK